MNKLRWENRISEWREDAGLSIEEAAEALGTTLYLYRRWELKETEPTATALLLMPRVFKVRKAEVQKLVDVAVA